MNLPVEIVANILSYRPTHPVAKVFLEFRDEFLEDTGIEIETNYHFTEYWLGNAKNMRLIEYIIGYTDDEIDYESFGWSQTLINDYEKICRGYGFGGY